MAQRPPTSRQPLIRTIALSLLSSVLLGCAFPPVDLKWLVWVGLVPLLRVIGQSQRPRRAFLLGYLAGFLFFLITLHPLVSAHAWTGWAQETSLQFAARMSRQWWFLQGVWVAFALWGALFWGLWAAMLQSLGNRSPWRMLVLAPSLWVVLAEWIRAKTTFDFAWAFLGEATVQLVTVRQLAALGGVWLLSVFVVFVNTAVSLLVCRKRPARESWSLLLALVGCGALAVGYGVTHQMRPPAQRTAPVPVAVLQYGKPTYALQDFLPIGLDRMYPRMIQEALAHGSRLIVLPESIALGATSLDGSTSPTKPADRIVPRSQWEAAFHQWLADSDAAVVLGLDTVERFQDHNTLVAWTRGGAIGWYHKRHLVPFSEYVPPGWNRIAIRGRSQYAPGHGTQLIRISDDLVVGGFICQEVLLPGLTRHSARDGATVLVTGGNDSVFADPAVATIHAGAAKLRAVETGRFLVRAMKTGISAVIDPYGNEIVRSRSGEPTMLLSRVVPQRVLTPYVRFGDWVVGLAGLLSVVGIGLSRRRPS